jgi:hypothetical protein
VDSNLLTGCDVGDPCDEAFVEGAHDGSIGILGIDAEGTVPNVHRHPVVLLHRRHRPEGETLEGLDDFLDGPLEGRMPQGAGHVPAPTGAFRFNVLGGFVTVGLSEKRDEGADQEPQLGVTAEEGLAEPVPLGWSAPPGGRPWLLFEDAGIEEAFQVRAHGGRMDAEYAGKLGDLPRSFLEGLDDGQPPRVTEKPVALGAHRVGETSVH